MVNAKPISLLCVREEMTLEAMVKMVASMVKAKEVVDPHTVEAYTTEHD